LGVQDVTRCHSYDVTGIKKTRNSPFVYACSCREYHLTSLIHRKILMGQNRRCLKCGIRVVFKRIEVAA
jgi:predicted SprT family Zn-dependent metalloprotease